MPSNSEQRERDNLELSFLKSRAKLSFNIATGATRIEKELLGYAGVIIPSRLAHDHVITCWSCYWHDRAEIADLEDKEDLAEMFRIYADSDECCDIGPSALDR